jgi:ABC-2 type transport system ATP-binding protein
MMLDTLQRSSATPEGESANQQYIIDVRALTHRYGERVIYENLSFTIAPGKITALLGKNGVGKTTLIRILMGFLKPTGGTAHVLGEEAHALSAATRARIGLIFAP